MLNKNHYMTRKVLAPYIIAKSYFLAISIFLFFRLFLFLSHTNEAKINGKLSYFSILESFVMGLRFDLLVSGFILVLPFLLLVIYDYKQKPILTKISFIWVFTVFGVVFMMTAGNVVYFNKFYKHIDSQTLEWFDHPLTVLGMIFEEPVYWYMVVVFFVVLFIFYLLLRKIFYKTKSHSFNPKKAILCYFISFILIFLSLRGTLKGAPLRNQDALKSKNSLLNKLALNPVFVFEKSMEEYYYYRRYPLRLIDEKEAIENLKKYLNIKKPEYKSPIARKIINDSIGTGKGNRKNVVLIFMESLGAWKMKHFGDTENRSPFLDSLFDHSMAFTNMYSSGTHTYCGIYSVDYGFPIIFEKHPLKDIPVKRYYGIPQILKEKGYQTSFFIPHGLEFDNLGAFLPQNAYDNIYFKKDYPKHAIRNIWGVDDRFLFHFALKKIDKMYQKGKPFLATILTISDHGPFYIPKDIKGKTDRIRASKFADIAKKEFMNEASKKPWFDNTIFVFYGDHGETHNMVYDIPLTYVHIPLLFYSKDLKPIKINKLTSQMDIMPILMRLLNINYVNNTLGKTERKYVIFDYDKLYGILDNDFLLIIDKHKTLGLYKYKTKDTKDYSSDFPEKRKKMETYLKSHIQGTKYILEHNLQDFKGKNNPFNIILK